MRLRPRVGEPVSGRRGFLRSVAIGSTACLVGCEPGSSEDDGGAPCEPIPDAPTPPDLDYPPGSYFEQVATDLDAAGVSSSAVFIDMDRMNENILAIKNAIAPLSYRIVEKSLPALELLEHVRTHGAETNEFLVLHLPFLPALLEYIPSAQVLIGKSHLTRAVDSFLSGYAAGPERDAVASQVTFLADNPTRLTELLTLARGLALGVPLRLAIEIDVGLRRSGVSDPTEFEAMLDIFARETGAIEFVGLLGYDGHIAHGTQGADLVDATWNAWGDSTAVYQSYVDILEARGMLRPDLIFNSGGTASFPMYTGMATPVNDVATGGGILRPEGYPNRMIQALRPAIFIATPVFAQFSEPQVPFYSRESSANALAGLQGLTIQGGSWRSSFTYPPEVRPAPLPTAPSGPPMVPNQSFVVAPASPTIDPGDWIFFHPEHADALFQFEQIHLVEDGRLLDTTWAAYPRRY